MNCILGGELLLMDEFGHEMSHLNCDVWGTDMAIWTKDKRLALDSGLRASVLAVSGSLIFSCRLIEQRSWLASVSWAGNLVTTVSTCT